MKVRLKMKNKSQRYDINRDVGLNMDPNILNIKCVYDYIY